MIYRKVIEMAIAKIVNTAREKLCKAHAGVIPLPAIKYMAFGDGGLNDQGNPYEVLGTETSMRNEVLKVPIESVEFPITTTCAYHGRVQKNELNGVKITEQALYDEDGDLVVYKTFPAREKDADEEFVFIMSEIF